MGLVVVYWGPTLDKYYCVVTIGDNDPCCRHKIPHLWWLGAKKTVLLYYIQYYCSNVQPKPWVSRPILILLVPRTPKPSQLLDQTSQRCSSHQKKHPSISTSKFILDALQASTQWTPATSGKGLISLTPAAGAAWYINTADSRGNERVCLISPLT